MDRHTRPLLLQDAKQASLLDKKWFGKFGISTEDIVKVIKTMPGNTLALIGKNDLLGFALFEVVESGMPEDYTGVVSLSGKILFIQQFTTSTNYSINSSQNDTLLLAAVEQKAKDLNCSEVWEALSMDHPYKKENNSEFDAFGLYEKHGYITDKNHPLTWQPSKDISIPCNLFTKRLRLS